MGDYLRLLNGVPTDAAANSTSSGAGDAGKIVKLNGSGVIDPTMLPAGVAPEQRTVVASEDLSAGDLVNLWNDSGTPKVRKADATSAGKQADGFVLAGVTSGQNATVWFEESVITGLSSLTPGATYFLATTAGAATATPPSGSGNVDQVIGRALSDTEILFRPGTPITVA